MFRLFKLRTKRREKWVCALAAKHGRKTAGLCISGKVQ